MSQDIHARLHAFATSLLEWKGALVEWPEGFEEGVAILPPELAAALHCPEEVVLARQSGDQTRLALHEAVGRRGERPSECGQIAVNLTSDFLDRAEELLRTAPRAFALRAHGLYLKQSSLAEPVARAFGWQNASVRIGGSHRAILEYHTWHFLASLYSEDRWEDVLSLTINAQSNALVGLPDLASACEIAPNSSPSLAPPDTYPQAARQAQLLLEAKAKGFIERLDARLERDRKRLREYYGALMRETKGKIERSKTEDEQRKREDQRRAVELELRRKLLELDERYAIRAELTPLAMVRTEMAVMAVECEVLRKRARRIHRVYWNPLLKQLEPLACQSCGQNIFSVAFTDEDVSPVCGDCARQTR